MQTVPPTKHARGCTVLTHVLDYVVSMPNAVSSIILQPCPGLCGVNAQCRVINHIATCTCNEGYEGDPFTSCRLRPKPIEPVIADDPCDPNPCGPNSLPPRDIGGRCQCNCMPEMIGSPPNCRPECVINSDCPSDKACISMHKQKMPRSLPWSLRTKRILQGQESYSNLCL